jgi:hypothetical protein
MPWKAKASSMALTTEKVVRMYLSGVSNKSGDKG